jgi:hypothetical protein
VALAACPALRFDEPGDRRLGLGELPVADAPQGPFEHGARRPARRENILGDIERQPPPPQDGRGLRDGGDVAAHQQPVASKTSLTSVSGSNRLG